MRVRTRTPEAPLITREEAFTFVSYLCLRCGANWRCVSGGTVGMNKAEYLIAAKHRTPVTPRMELGAELHAEFSAELPKAGKLGAEQYHSMIRDGLEVVMKEVKVCRMTGYRGTIDILRVKKVGDEYLVTIQENKSHPSSGPWFIKWMLQVAEYGYILNSMDMAYVHDDENPNKWWPIYLPEDEEPIINVRAFLHYLDNSRPDYPDVFNQWFSQKNKIQEFWMQPWVTRMYIKAKQNRKLHRRGLYMLEVPDEPEPRFFGKRKVLIKTPPRLGPRNNFE